MPASKAELGLWAAGGISLLGALLFRKRLEPAAFRNALIFSGGCLATAGVMTGVRRATTSRQLLDAPLGLALTEVHTSNGKTLRVWDDQKMGIRERIALLQKLTAESVKNPTVRKIGLAITGHGQRRVQVGEGKGAETLTIIGAACPARDDVCEAKAIFDWVAKPENVRYTGDTGDHALWPGGPVEPVDEFQSALRTIEFKGGDCDDHSVVTAALAIKNGFPAKFRITSNTGESWDHIYTMVGVPKLDPKRWIALDTTLGPGKFDKQPGRAKQVDFAA